MPLTLRMDPGAPPGGEKKLAPDEDEVTTVAQQAPASSVRRGPRARRCPACQQAFSGEARFCPFDGDALVEAPDWNPSADPLIGQTVDGRYEVVSVIGEGGMGTVYEVRHVALGRRFALKVLRRDIADAEHTARFIQEAKAAAAIGHPNIVAVSDFGVLTIAPKAGEPKGAAVPYFVMEFLTGISLASLLRAEKTLAPARAGQLLLQCASGLAAAHAAGVIHRDLKPDNVFLVRNGDREFVKLLDFGVAKMAGAGRLTRAGMVFGTPHYMSPEQAAGESVDHRADVYALGVILYECFAGRVPFEADTYMGVLTKHMFATPEPIDRVVSDPGSLGALGPIAMRCLAKSPHDRYASMAELVAATEAALADPARPAASAPEGRISLGPKVARSDDRGDTPSTPMKPVVGPVGIGVTVVALGLAAVLGYRALRGASAEEPAPPASATAVASSAPPPVAPSSAPAASASAPAAPASTDLPAASAKPSAAPSGKASSRAGAPSKTAPSAKPGGRRKHGGGDVVDPWGN